MADITFIRILSREDDAGLSRLLQRTLLRRGFAVDLMEKALHRQQPIREKQQHA